MSDLIAFATDLNGAGTGRLPGDFYARLQPASWRGQRFAVLGDTVRAGRRKMVHEYPFRDGSWVEDLGKRGRVYGFSGFLIGDDVGEKIKALLDVVEEAGPGTLVHPTFGSRECELLDFDAGEEWDAGRVWRFRMDLVEPVQRGLQLLPDASEDTQASVESAADDAEGATSDGFLDQLGSGLQSGVKAAQQAVAAVRPYVAAATRLAGDASRMVNMVNSLSGGFGRYSSGRGTSLAGVQGLLRTPQQVGAAVSRVIGAATTARTLVVQTGADLAALVDL